MSMTDHFSNIPIEPGTPKKTASSKKQRPSRKKTSRKSSPRQQIKMPKLLIGVILLALIIGLYGLLGFVGVPKYITSALPDSFRSHSGFNLEPGTIRFNPFTFSLSVEDLVIREEHSAPTDTPFITFETLQAKLAPLSMLRGDLVAKNLQITTLRARIVRNNFGEYNISRLLGKSKESAHSDIMDFSELPFFFSLNNINISDSSLSFVDTPQNKTHNVTEIELALPNLSNIDYETSDYIQPSFSAVVNGSPVKLSSRDALSGERAGDTAKQTTLSSTLKDVDLKLYAEYLPIKLPLRIQEGKADAILQLTFNPAAEANKISIQYVLEATKMAMSSKDNSFRLDIPFVKIEGDIQPVTGDNHIKNLALREPAAHAAQTYSINRLNKLFAATTSSDAINDIAKRNPKMAIDLFIVDGGKLTFYNSNNKPVENWEAIQLSLKDYANGSVSTSSPATGMFRISGNKSGSQARLNWQGTLSRGNLPAGQLQLDNFKAATLFSWLNLKQLQAKSGTADLRAHLSLTGSQDKNSGTTHTFKEGTLSFKDLNLIHGKGKNSWYTAPVTKISGFSQNGKTLALGQVLMKNGTVTLNKANLPEIFSQLTAKNSTVTLDDLEFIGSISFSGTRKELPSQLLLNNVNLRAIHLADADYDPKKNNLTFTANHGKNGVIEAKGRVNLQGFTTNLSTSFKHLDAIQLLPWFGSRPLLTESRGLLSGKGTLKFPNTSYRGHLQVSSGAFGKGDNAFLSWQTLTLEEVEFVSKPAKVAAAKCNINSPRIQWLRNSSQPHPWHILGTFFNQHLGTTSAVQGKTSTTSINLQSVEFSNGSIDYVDSRFTPQWKGEITGVNGSFSNLNSAKDSPAAELMLAGNLDGIPFILNGTADLLAPIQEGSLNFTLDGYPLPLFHSQIASVADIDSSRGEFDITTNMALIDDMIASESTLTFANVEPESTTAASALALALLTDSDRKFTFTLRNKRQPDVPTLPLFSQVITHFQKLMVKASLSPLLLVSGDFADMAGQEYAEFLPGQVVLSGKGRESLARFSSLLGAHPQLAITLTGSADLKHDSDALKKDLEETEATRVAKENQRRQQMVAEERKKRQNQLDAARNESTTGTGPLEQPIPPDQLPLYTPVKPQPVVIDKPMLEELARERAKVIMAFFTSQLALQPERIKLNDKTRIISSESENGNMVFFSLGTVQAKPE